jgi:hypothetical protein
VREEASRANLKERLASRVSTLEKMVKAPIQVEVADANVIPHVDGNHVNEEEPRPEDVPGGVALISGSLGQPDFCLPGETALDYTTSLPRSFDIVNLGAGELWLSGYMKAMAHPPARVKWQQLQS